MFQGQDRSGPVPVFFRIGGRVIVLLSRDSPGDENNGRSDEQQSADQVEQSGTPAAGGGKLLTGRIADDDRLALEYRQRHPGRPTREIRATPAAVSVVQREQDPT